MVHTGQSGQHGSTVGGGVDRAVGSLQTADAGVVVDSHDQDVAQLFRLVEVGHMAPVQDVETAVGAHDPSACGSVLVHDPGELGVFTGAVVPAEAFHEFPLRAHRGPGSAHDDVGRGLGQR